MPLISTFIPLASISFLNSSLVYSTLCSTPFFKCLINLSNWAWSKFNPDAPQTYSTHRHPPHLRSTLSFYLLWPQTFESSLSFPPTPCSIFWNIVLVLISNTSRTWPSSLFFLWSESLCFLLYYCSNHLCMLILFSRVQLSETLWTIAHQAPLSIGILQARMLEWIAMPSSRGSSQPRDQTQFSLIAGRFFTTHTIWEAP